MLITYRHIVLLASLTTLLFPAIHSHASAQSSSINSTNYVQTQAKYHQKVDAYLATLQPPTSFDKLESGNDLFLELPPVAAAGSILVKFKSTIPQTDRIWLLTLSSQPEGPSALLASIELTPTAKPEAEIYLNLQRTQYILLLVRANGKYYGLNRQLKIGQTEKKK